MTAKVISLCEYRKSRGVERKSKSERERDSRDDEVLDLIQKFCFDPKSEVDPDDY